MSGYGRGRRSGAGVGTLAAATAVVGLLVAAGVAPDVAAPTELAGVGAASAGAGNATLAVAADDVAFMNRIYGSQNDEVVYCGRVHGGVVGVSLAEMVARGEDFARFDASHCHREGTGPVVNLHTHPGGAEGLSVSDVELLSSGDYRYVCVQHDRIAGDGDAASGLACYEERGGEVRRVGVGVAG